MHQMSLENARIHAFGADIERVSERASGKNARLQGLQFSNLFPKKERKIARYITSIQYRRSMLQGKKGVKLN